MHKIRCCRYSHFSLLTDPTNKFMLFLLFLSSLSIQTYDVHLNSVVYCFLTLVLYCYYSFFSLCVTKCKIINQTNQTIIYTVTKSRSLPNPNHTRNVQNISFRKQKKKQKKRKEQHKTLILIQNKRIAIKRK